MKPKRIKLRPWIYPVDLLVYNTDNIGYIEDKYNLAKMDSSTGFVWTTKKSEILCVFSASDITDRIIVHESKHIVNRLFSIIGQDLDVKNDEVECYLLDTIFQTLHNKLM